MTSRILIKDIHTLYGASRNNPHFLKAKDMDYTETLRDAWLLVDNDQILDYGSRENMPVNADVEYSAQGGCVMPAWCDSHTHIVFAAGREGEFVDRIRGKSYEEIAAAGGGILNSAARLREMPEDQLYESALRRLHEVMQTGTGAIEIKSGYGLTLESELKMLRVIQRLKSASGVMIKSTFLGAHAIPAEYKNDREGYLRLLIEEMIPAVAAEKLADYCDVFCDKGFFTPEETDKILEAGWKYGLKPKIHANELAVSGGVQAGIRNHAISVDHLECTTQEEIDALKNASTIPTVLPSVSFFLRIPYAPARQMIDQGLGVAIASDFNPGSSPSGNIPLLMSIACNNMRLTPTEAFNAVTINGACAMELQEHAGSITPGKKANLTVTKPGITLEKMVYYFGSGHIKDVFIRGQRL
ncbi:MAG: imidazolonepropionase [Saprospiraceae bacterium]|nr:imidazolonepropionase [Saprospiraceae bacterium]